jgi:hypothetical protein
MGVPLYMVPALQFRFPGIHSKKEPLISWNPDLDLNQALNMSSSDFMWVVKWRDLAVNFFAHFQEVIGLNLRQNISYPLRFNMVFFSPSKYMLG